LGLVGSDMFIRERCFYFLSKDVAAGSKNPEPQPISVTALTDGD
jgi:hypothetical protein